MVAWPSRGIVLSNSVINAGDIRVALNKCLKYDKVRPVVITNQQLPKATKGYWKLMLDIEKSHYKYMFNQFICIN